MKNLFNNISQDEKNRILEMHSAKNNVISEQNAIRPTPTPKPLPKPIDGQTVNLYRDKGETNLFGTFKIIKLVKEGNTIKVILDNPKRLEGVNKYLEFKCGNSEPIVFMKGTDPHNYNLGLFNLKFLNRLSSEHCATSRGGVRVPKADFAMNNQQDNTTTDVG
jgi:hypothetical protein